MAIDPTQPRIIVAAILEREGKILLGKQNKPGSVDHGKWDWPAGHVDLDENPHDAVVREVREESGYFFTPTDLVGIYSTVRGDLEANEYGYPHLIKIVFVGTVGEDGNAHLHEDVIETHWFTLDEIEAMNLTTLRDEPVAKQILKDYKTGVRFPLSILHHAVIEK